MPTAEPGWLRFRADAVVDPRTVASRYAESLQLAPGTDMRLVDETTDDLGITHLRYQQYFQGIEVEGAQWLVHARGNRALSANGVLVREFSPAVTRPAIDEARALAAVRERMGPGPYYDGSQLVREMATGPSGATPPGTLVFVELPASRQRVLAWRFDVYVQPLDLSRRVYVDAATGAVVKEVPLLPHCFAGSGPTTFRGNQNFNTARANIPGFGDRFVLMDDCHANQLHALSFNFTSGSSKEIFDSDNNWADQSQAAVTSFWALGVAYDYFDLVLKRKGYDNKNANMVIVNDPTLNQNANGGGGVINLGIAGPGNGDDYNTTDIVGHEYTHNVIETSAKLGYDVTKESAALNESFSDIFGEMTEAWEETTTAPDWIIGADKGCAAGSVCRNLINPKAFSQPDTYQGNFWQAGAGIDPHNNGTVQNRWFALVATGGSGTNVETTQAYNITGIGIAKAQKIAYRNLLYYLTPASDYTAARDGSIQAAIDLYGDGSAEEAAVTQAWCAVKLCPFTIPTAADRFDQPGGNPNPASPDHNDTAAGATPIPAASWAPGKRPTLSVTELNLFPVGDVDYFQITLPSGEIGYTRDGAFQVSDQGELVTADGYPVQPGITIPQGATSFSVSKTGEVQVTLQGNPQPQTLGQLELATFMNESGLAAQGGNLFLETAASGQPNVASPGQPGFGTLTQGFVEASNVNPVAEITALITAQRAYEMNSRIVKTADEMLATTSQLR